MNWNLIHNLKSITILFYSPFYFNFHFKKFGWFSFLSYTKKEWIRFKSIRPFLPFCKCICSAHLVTLFRQMRLRLKRQLWALRLAALLLSIHIQVFTSNSVGIQVGRMTRKCILLSLQELCKLLILICLR